MGDERVRKSVTEGMMAGVKTVEVVGLDMEEEREAAFEEAVEKACNILGKVDAFVNCHTYEGKNRLVAVNYSVTFIGSFC